MFALPCGGKKAELSHAGYKPGQPLALLDWGKIVQISSIAWVTFFLVSIAFS